MQCVVIAFLLVCVAMMVTFQLAKALTHRRRSAAERGSRRSYCPARNGPPLIFGGTGEKDRRQPLWMGRQLRPALSSNSTHMEKAGDYVAAIAQAIFNSAIRLAKSLTPKSIKAKHPSQATVQPKHRNHFPNFGLVATALPVRPAKGQGPQQQKAARHGPPAYGYDRLLKPCRLRKSTAASANDVCKKI